MNKAPKKAIIIIILALIICCIVTGCWDRQELNEINIIMGIAQDFDENAKQITVVGIDPSQKPMAKEGGKGTPGYSIFSAKGRTLFDAEKNLAMLSPRRDFWAHCDLILVSKEQAQKEGVRDMLGFFSRDYSRRLTATLIVTEGRADEMFLTGTTVSQNPAQEILDIQRFVEKSGKGIHKSIYEFLAETEAVTGVSLTEFYIIKDFGGDTNISGRGEEKFAQGIAVFKDYKLIGLLSPEETQGANWLRKDMLPGCAVTFPSQKDGPVDVSFEIDIIKTNIEPLLTANGSIVRVGIEVTGKIIEYDGQENLMDVKILKAIEEACSEQIKREILRSWDKCQQELEVDDFRLGDLFANKYKTVLKLSQEEWREVFLDMQLELDIKTTIRNSGLRREALKRG